MRAPFPNNHAPTKSARFARCHNYSTESGKMQGG
nr:MAG TPA: hypothetical protein [Caudoviricetes sp.]